MKPLADQKGDVGALAPIGKPNSSQAGSKSRMGQKADRNPYRKPGTVAGRSFIRSASTGKNYSGLSQDWGRTQFFVASQEVQ